MNNRRCTSRTLKCIFRQLPLWLLILLPAAAPAPIAAGPKGFSAGGFGSVIVLENGRKKPFDTFARNKLQQYSGKRRVAKRSALEWMCRLLFTPQRGDFDKVFLINNPEVAQTLGMTPERRRRYSYAALSGAAEAIQKYYDAAQKNTGEGQSPFDREITRIYANLVDYRSLASTFSFLEPNPDFHIGQPDSFSELPPLLTDTRRAPSFFDMLAIHTFIGQRMSGIRDLGSDSLSAVDQAILMVTKVMYSISASAGNAPPHLLPATERGAVVWYSPWGLIAAQRSAAAANPALQSLMKVRDAFQSGNQASFDTAVDTFNKTVRSAGRPGEVPDPSLELLYNRLNTFFIAKILLGLASIFALIALFSNGRVVAWCSSGGIIAGWLLCTVGIILRMVIMRHPPVTNLYETFIFVAWTTVIIGMALEYLRIRPVGLITASLAGFIFLHIAGRYAADGDTMGMLAAVLDSGFWLTTHIITISLGYAGCLGAGFIGHIYLVQRLLFPDNRVQLKSVSSAVYGVFAFGMLFTVIGTVTGGMWADQAWGRFWGWDPKENGALLIILWSMIVFHGRLGRMIADTGLAVGAVIAAVLVMCTWIGVNLLGTGMHSYGFTASGAKMLFGYMGFEAVFLSAFGLLQGKRRKPVRI